MALLLARDAPLTTFFRARAARSPQPVLPAFPPAEVLDGKVFQRRTVNEVIQAPPGGDVPDDQNPLPVPPQGQVTEETACIRPLLDNWPGSHPVARPCSLSTVVE